MHPCLESLILTEQELQLARKQVAEMAYRKWEKAGRPESESNEFWLEAEREWMEHIYVPHRYPATEDME